MKLSNKLLIFLLSCFGLVTLAFKSLLPHYLFFALLLLVIPAIFFVFRREKTLDERKLILILVISLIGGFIWDSIAIHFNIWGFPNENVIGWIFGIPVEEYIFFLTFPTISLGIYSSLPSHRKKHLLADEHKINDIIILLVVFALQIGVFTSMLFYGMQSYIKWLLFFSGFPAAFYLFRKGERIDELNLLITVSIWVLYMVIIDPFFIISRSWIYYDTALIGKIGVIPIDDILFTVFCSILTIGIYTTIPKKLLYSPKS